MSERLRVLKEVAVGDPAADTYAPGTLSTAVNRLTLREVLAAAPHQLGGPVNDLRNGGVRRPARNDEDSPWVIYALAR